MTKILNTVLLIDDDEPTNFYHEMILNKSGCAEKVVVFQSAMEALEYLKSKSGEQYPQPDLIFLDINMPAMNGWEFLEAYDKLDNIQKGKVIVVLLTTSLNPGDKDQAEKNHQIKDFKNKPLTVETVREIIESHF